VAASPVEDSRAVPVAGVAEAVNRPANAYAESLRPVDALCTNGAFCCLTRRPTGIV